MPDERDTEAKRWILRNLEFANQAVGPKFHLDRNVPNDSFDLAGLLRALRFG